MKITLRNLLGAILQLRSRANAFELEDVEIELIEENPGEGNLTQVLILKSCNETTDIRVEVFSKEDKQKPRCVVTTNEEIDT